MENTTPKTAGMTRRLCESAIMLAAATVLSLFTFTGPWALGGGITICGMLPVIIIAHRHGTRWGLLTAFVSGLIQLVIGFANVQYASSALMALAVVLLDYLLAYTVIGLSAVFDGRLKSRRLAITLGILLSFALRLACHYFSGVMVWERLLPNALGWAPPIWSIAYNGSFMLGELIITLPAALLLDALPLGLLEPVGGAR